MADPVSSNTKKRGHSLWSFFWTAGKMARKRAWAQLGNLLVIVSLIQFGLLARWLSKITEGVDVNFWLTFSPVIISILGFLVFLFRAAHKIYERALNSDKSSNDDIPESEPPKPAMFVLFILIVLACVGLVAAIFTEQNTQIAHLKSLIPIPKQDAIAPPPAAVIHIDTSDRKKSEPPLAQPVTAVTPEPPKQFEETLSSKTTDTNTSDLVDILGQAAAEQAAKQKPIDDGTATHSNRILEKSLTHFEYALKTFSDLLVEKASKQNDQVETRSSSPTFLLCLPRDLDIHVAETNIAEIFFKKDTNWSFQISITGRESEERRRLRIKSRTDALEITPVGDVGSISTDIISNGIVIYNPNRPIEESHAAIDRALRFLIQLHKIILNETNK